MLNAIRYGLLFALAIFLWAVAETAVGLHDRYIRYHEYLSYFFAVPAVGIMYWGINAGEQAGGPGMRFGQAFGKGLRIMAVVAILCPVVWYVFCTFVNPMFLDNMINYAIVIKGMAASSAVHRYGLLNYLFMSTFSTVLIGSVISLVIAIIVAGRRHQS